MGGKGGGEVGGVLRKDSVESGCDGGDGLAVVEGDGSEVRGELFRGNGEGECGSLCGEMGLVSGVGGGDAVSASEEGSGGERSRVRGERRCAKCRGVIEEGDGSGGWGGGGQGGSDLAGSVADDGGGVESECSGSGDADAGDGPDGRRWGGVGGELPDALVVGVGESDKGGGRECGAAGGVERGGSGGGVVSCEGLGAVAGDGGDDAGGCVDTADAVVGGVGQVEVAGGVEGQAVREGEGCVSCGGAVTGVARCAGAGDGGDDAGGGVDAANAVVVGVSEVEVAGGVKGEAGGGIDGGGVGWALVSGEGLRAVPGDGGDDVGGG